RRRAKSSASTAPRCGTSSAPWGLAWTAWSRRRARRGEPLMSVLVFTLVVGLGAVAAGFLGALTGLGGGVVIVPLLAIGFGVDIRYAAGASLVSVIATSSGAAAAYVREGYSNMRVGMLLEVATTFGALAGAVAVAAVPASGIAVVFGVV